MGSEGELGKKQTDKLAKLMVSKRVKACAKKVVYLHHHPFDPELFHHLKDAPALGRAIRGNRVDLLLFGHNHDGLVWNEEWGIPRCYDAGTSTGKNKEKPARVRVIDILGEPAD